MTKNDLGYILGDFSQTHLVTLALIDIVSNGRELMEILPVQKFLIDVSRLDSGSSIKDRTDRQFAADTDPPLPSKLRLQKSLLNSCQQN
jgi:hypothetical protein